jgi:outer membrane protein assembly factor BamB
MNRVIRAAAGAVALAAGVWALAAAGCGLPSDTGGVEANLPAAPAALASNGMAVRWHTQAVLAPKTRVVEAWVRGGYVVLHGSDHRVYVIDAETGVRLWSKGLARPHEALWPPTAHRGTLWFATTTGLMGFRGADGENIVEEWLRPEEVVVTPGEGAAGEAPVWRITTPEERKAASEVARIERREAELAQLLAAEKEKIELDFAPSGPPATDGTHVFMPDARGWLQAVSIRPGVVDWGRWTNDAMTAGPVVDASRVYFAGHDGRVYASTQNVRNVVWEYQTEGAVTADLRMTETGMVLVGSLDYSLYCFDGASGVLEWDQLPNRRYNAGEPVRKPPYTFGEQVFLFTGRAGLTVLDTTSGKTLWTLQDGADLITADTDTVYVLGRGNDLLAADRTSGEVRFAIPLRRGTLVAINETGTGVLYLATPEGHVLAAAKAAEAEADEAPPPAP